MLLGTGVATLGAVLLAKTADYGVQPTDVEPFIKGTKLKLVAEYKPLKIYIYADTASNDKLPDYAIFEGPNPVFLRENQPSNVIETTHFENSVDVLRTEQNNSGHILRRWMTTYGDNSTQPAYGYVDTNGDGLWDRFHIYSERKAFVRSNLCWVPVHQSTQYTNPIPQVR